jgi:hypothetical protein
MANKKLGENVVNLNAKITKELYEQATGRADEVDMSLSEYVRSLIIKDIHVKLINKKVF